ncbi:MAG: hypothetical protein DWQ05_07575 [Calditrichaeota bacterium]|nr:MAG: hypothetical protein DWQ05_07575 [Calditrichota bacterium]
MNFKKIFSACAIVFIAIPSFLNAQNGNISGYMFGDYYMQLSHPDSATDAENRNGFQFRRIYFNYENKIDENFSMRFRLEMNSQNYDKSANMVPYVKHAYLAWNNLIPNAKLYFGLSGTPTWNHAEKIWGYRSVSKTIMDLNKVSSSADFGVAAKGKIGASGTLNYFAHFANGSGKKGEKDQYKKLYFNLPVILQKSIFIVPYIDFEGGDDGKSKSLVALFAGYNKGKISSGVELFQKTSKEALDGDLDLKQSGFSVFGRMKTAEKVCLFARFDSYDPNTDLDNDASTLIIGGFDYLAGKNVHIMPNVKLESYEMSGMDSNTLAEVTIYFKFQ